ncbi:MAG: hypothetical protein JSW27_20600 [Phycisphaerales bacterium]|nr:MAG: hypothetical protein JSW27_20600 [Phycisphaerales bacterium]
MQLRKQIHRSDIAFFLAVVLFLLANLAAVGTAGRERAKRAVCLSHLKTLTQAWRQFADDHDGQLVNGAAGIDRPNDPAWVGRCWHSNFAGGLQLPEDVQREEIRRGALWPYLEELNLYRCPSGYKGEMLNYTIVDAMYGLSRSGTSSGGGGARIGDTVLWIQNLNEIITPGADERMVFIDEGWVAPDSFSTHYRYEAWWDAPPVRHNDGTTVSFADGHAEYWQWKGPDTIEHGRRNDRALLSFNSRPQTPEGREDLHRLQRAVWGRLGYEPTEQQLGVE